MRSIVFLLLGLLVPAVAGAQASHEDAQRPAERTAGPARAVGPKAAPSAPHEESRAEPTPTRRTRTPTPTEREVEPTRPVVRDVLKEDAAKLEAFKAAQAARSAKADKAEKAEKAEKGDKAEKIEKPEKSAKDEAPAVAEAAPKGPPGRAATMSGRILTKSNKQLQDVAERINARIDAVNASAPAPTEKNADVEAIVAQINRRLEREAAARSVRRQQARKPADATPRVSLSWRVPVQWSELQSIADAEIPRPTQLSWPVPSWVPSVEATQRQHPAGRGQGPVE